MRETFQQHVIVLPVLSHDIWVVPSPISRRQRHNDWQLHGLAIFFTVRGPSQAENTSRDRAPYVDVWPSPPATDVSW